MDRERASRFSIMLGIPTICGAMALLTSQIPIADLSSISISFIGAVLISFFVAYASIHYFLKYVSKWGFSLSLSIDYVWVSCSICLFQPKRNLVLMKCTRVFKRFFRASEASDEPEGPSCRDVCISECPLESSI